MKAYGLCSIYTNKGKSYFSVLLFTFHIFTFYSNSCRIPLCALINEYLRILATKYPTVKFLKSISTTCIPNYPDKNLPTIFVYFEGELKQQLTGPLEFRGPNLTQDGKNTIR